MKIACGQITWRNSGLSDDDVFADIAAAGYDGAVAIAASLRDVDEVQERFRKHGLKPAPGYVGAKFWDVTQRSEITEKVATQAEIMRAFGLSDLYVAANLTEERRALSGHVGPDDMPDSQFFSDVAETLHRCAEEAARHNVTLCFHNHVGSFIETRAELDELFEQVDRAVIKLGPDTGHLAWAGDDVGDLIRDYAADINTLHVKDIDADVRDRARKGMWNYAQASDAGIFTELGNGLVDFPDVFRVLEQHNFDGWVIVETDVTQLDSARESAEVSRTYLLSIGY